MANPKNPVTPTVDTHDSRAPRDERGWRADERQAADRERAHDADRERTKDKDDEPEREGDVLGISDSTAPIPQATTRKGGHPRGIEVGESSETPGTGDVKQGPGATSIDMGGGGEGHKVKR